ncbi:putative hydrolase or acyltransferase of alpha/beta superfamily [uncultured spirochete]|jgi:pimeloyl-ACP methyl ester carboxylesterase|uniref:Putative hydrolase or acyltransferase of alpha/beta superfamily n=1 Tax=uncultured spirochete TaxID=156406 RepID=A0A3P3XMM2_9SPIR|nr:putative hydrolase or acyltransferase of alpha/beta superfamily [uncultured spirochete]
MASGFAAVIGVSIFFVTAGNGVPVVYVHGNTGSSVWFRPVMDVPGCRAVAIDMPNFGQSSPLDGDISIQRYAAYVAGFMDLKGIKEAVVVGHSLGGCVVQALALERPGLVKAMVLVDSGAPNGLVTPKDRHPVIELMRTNRAVLEQALKATVPTLKDDALFKTIVDDAQKMAPPAWIGNAEALSHFDITSRCAEYEGQVLVMRGTLDPIITDEMARATAGAYRHAKLVTLEGVGHSVTVENPVLFLQIFRDFLAEQGICKK